jgi:hypothetical protein
MLQNKVVELLLSELAEQEKATCVVYLSMAPIPAGNRLEFPRQTIIDVKRPAWIAFIDLQPYSDWGHPCRYVLIDDESGETRSYDSQFPPFRPGSPWKWQIVYPISNNQNPKVLS